MSIYLNCAFADGERLAVEIASVTGWGDFCRWAVTLPDAFPLVRRLAVEGAGEGSPELEEQIGAAVKASPPDASAGAVAARLIEVVPHQGTLAVSDEPDDSELDALE